MISRGPHPNQDRSRTLAGTSIQRPSGVQKEERTFWKLWNLRALLLPDLCCLGSRLTLYPASPSILSRRSPCAVQELGATLLPITNHHRCYLQLSWD